MKRNLEGQLLQQEVHRLVVRTSLQPLPHILNRIKPVRRHRDESPSVRILKGDVRFPRAPGLPDPQDLAGAKVPAPSDLDPLPCVVGTVFTHGLLRWNSIG